MVEAVELKHTPPEEELRDLMERTGLRCKELLTQMMREKSYLFRNTGHWDTGIIINEDTPEQRFELKPVLELGDEGEGSMLNYFLTEEGIFKTGQAEDEKYGYQPVWDEDTKEIEVSDYPSHVAYALYEFKSREERFGNPQGK